MKKQMTRIDRSGAKLLPGAMALAATAASSQAATVQITFTGNKISSTNGNQLNADLTGDTVADLTFNPSIYDGSVFVEVNGGKFIGGLYFSSQGSKSYIANARFAGRSIIGPGDIDSVSVENNPASATYLNPISFQDTSINGGAVTEAWLEVSAYADSTQQYAELTRLIFNDDSTTRPTFTEIPGAQTEWVAPVVPEPSSLGLLALGAGGLLTRRSRANQAA